MCRAKEWGVVFDCELQRPSLHGYGSTPEVFFSAVCMRPVIVQSSDPPHDSKQFAV